MATTDTTARDPVTELYATTIDLHHIRSAHDTEVTRLQQLGVCPDVIGPLLEYVAALNIADRLGVNAENRRRQARGEQRLPWSRYAEFTVDAHAHLSGRWVHIVSTILGGQMSVHASVERATGHVYEPEGWRRFAPGVRFRLADPDTRERLWDIATRPSFIHGSSFSSR